MTILVRLGLRELRNHWRFSVFFILNLASGLVGLVLISTLLQSVRSSMDSRSQSLLGADLSVSTRNPLSADEERAFRASLPTGSQVSNIVDFFSMLEASPGKDAEESRLVQVRAVDDLYPFYGGLKLKAGGDVAGAAALTQGPAENSVQTPSAWIEVDTAEDFALKNGAAVTIGGLNFQLGDSIVEDSTQGMMTLAAAPRVLVGKKWLSKEYLDARGTTLRHSWLVRLPPGAVVEDVKKTVEKIITEPSVRIQTHRESSEGLARLLNYFSDYLALVSLASLSLAALGVVYQFRRYFLSRARSVAIFLSVGATPARALGILAIQLVALSLAGSLLALAMTALALPLFAQALAPFSVVPIAVRMNAGVALKALATGVGLSFLLCLPQLLSLRKFNASELFREQTQFQVGRRSLLWYAPAVAAYAGLCIVYANSFWIAAFFLLGLGVSVAFFTFVPWSLIRLMDSRARHPQKVARIETRLALSHLRRNPASTLLVSVCLGLVTLLGSLLPQIRTSVREEIQGPASQDRPSFFLLDIQPEQVEPLGKFLLERGATLAQPSALIRGRLVAENGKKASRQEITGNFVTREEEQETAFRNRGFNLSYRDNLSPSETLLEGRPFNGAWTRGAGVIPEVSVETRFARRLGWKLGDVLTFDVAGEEFQGKVVNLRSVRWASFQPNFFVVFQKGVLEEVPSVFIGTVPRVAQSVARSIARELPKQFTNVSVIPVDKVLDRLYSLSEQMMQALLLTTLWVVLASILTLYSISRYEAFSRLRDMNLLKVIGATRGAVRGVFLRESWILGVGCAVMGALGGAGLSYVLMRWGLEGTWKFDGLAVGAAAFGTVAWMHCQTLFTARQVWQSQPRDLLV